MKGGKVLITGSCGFIGSHLCTEFVENGSEVIRSGHHEGEGIAAMNVLDQTMVRSVLERCQPDVLINMAGQSSVSLSWEKPQLTVELNTVGMINILEAVRAVKPEMRVIAIGSSDEYGRLGDMGANVTEDVPVKPITPYAISKQAQELFSQLYVNSYGIDIRMIRLFNVAGFGQKKGFMISDFASGIAEAEAGLRDHLSVGNLSSARDFTHVKDACRAVRLIAEIGHKGEVYNICSGITHTAQEVLDKLIGMARTDIKVVPDPGRMRPSDTPVVCGNHDKLTAHTGWTPERTIDEMLKDALDYWRETVNSR